MEIPSLHKYLSEKMYLRTGHDMLHNYLRQETV